MISHLCWKSATDNHQQLVNILQSKSRPHLSNRFLPSNNPVSILGAINALFNLGLAIGALTQGWLADRLGRKKSFYLAATCSLVGAALITAAVVIEMLIVMRLLHGFGLGMLICLVPLYLTEVSRFPTINVSYASGGNWIADE